MVRTATSSLASFWNYFHSGWRVDVCGPSEGKTAWQMFASALHGSRGLLHFVLTGGAGDIPHPPHLPPPPPPSPSPSRSVRGASGDVDHGYPGILTYEGGPAAGPVYGYLGSYLGSYLPTDLLAASEDDMMMCRNS